VHEEIWVSGTVGTAWRHPTCHQALYQNSGMCVFDAQRSLES